MDFSQYSKPETKTIHLNGPDGAPLFDDKKPVTVTVTGFNSDAVRDAMIQYPEKENATAEERRIRDAQILAAGTVAWDGFTAGGKPIEPTFDNCVSQYSPQGCNFLRVQITEAMIDVSAKSGKSKAG